MADNNKTITIGAKQDPSLKSVLSSVEKEISKANKTLGAGTTANPGMLKHLKEMASAFMGVKKSGTDAFKTLAQEAERAANKEQTALGRMKKYVSELAGAYSSLGAAQKSASGAQFSHGRGANHQPQITRWTAGGGVSPPINPPTQPPAGGGAGGAGPSGKPPMSAADMSLMAGTIARAVGGVMQQVGGFAQGVKNMDIQNVAEMQQMTTGRFLQAGLRGDLSDLYILNNKKSMLGGGTVGQKLDKHAGGQVAPLTGLAGDLLAGLGVSASGLAGTIPGVPGPGGGTKTLGDMANSAADVGRGATMSAKAVADYMYGSADLAEVKSKFANVDAYRASDPMMQGAIDMIQEEKHMRASHSRQLMGQELSAYGLGGGFGYSRGEAGGVAGGLQRLNGMRGMFDTYESPEVDPTLRPIEYTWQEKQQGIWANDPQFVNQPEPEKKIRTGRGLARSAMLLAGHGIDMGVGQNALSSIFQATGGKNAEGSMQALERAIARGTVAGYTDPRTQEELVGALGQAVQGRMMGNDTSAIDRLANLLTGGGKGDGTVADAQAKNKALTGLNALSANPYIQGKQLAFAKTISNDQIQQEYLGRATVEQLAAGPDARMKAVGITKAMTDKTLRYTMGDVVSSVAGASPKLQAALKKGGPIDEELLMSEGFGRVRGFDNDREATAGARIYNAAFGDLDSKTARSPLSQHTSGAAIAAISTEEKTKQMLEKYVKDLTDNMMAQQQQFFTQLEKSREDTEKYDIKQGNRFVVEIIRPADQIKTPPTPKSP